MINYFCSNRLNYMMIYMYLIFYDNLVDWMECSVLLLEPNVVHINIIQFRQKKNMSHSIEFLIDRNIMAGFISEEIWTRRILATPALQTVTLRRVTREPNLYIWVKFTRFAKLFRNKSVHYKMANKTEHKLGSLIEIYISKRNTLYTN